MLTLRHFVLTKLSCIVRTYVRGRDADRWSSYVRVDYAAYARDHNVFP